MNGQSVVGQWQAEILDLEEVVNHLDRRKKQAKAEILQAAGQGPIFAPATWIPL